MKLSEYIKKRKLGLSVYLLFFTFLVMSLVLINNYPGLFPVSILLVFLIFIFSQYFDFEYRYFIGSALALLIVCPFLLIYNQNTLAEYFADYVYGFLVIGIIGYFFDNLREKLKSKGYFKVYKTVFLSILICVLLVSAFFVYKDYFGTREYVLIIKNNAVKVASQVKDSFLWTFNKRALYSKKDKAEVDGEILNENIMITVDKPEENSSASGIIGMAGWIIEGNSKENSGIDKIDIFIDGKPGEGKYLGRVSHPVITGNPATVDFITNLYIQFYNRRPQTDEINYWVIKMEWGLVSYSEMPGIFLSSKEFNERKISNEDFINILYQGLFDRPTDTDGFKYWVNILKSGANKSEVAAVFLNSDEFKRSSEGYYSKVTIKDTPLDVIRKDVGEKYGKQFDLSGFGFEFNSMKFENGKHIFYVYAHSPIFGWDYIKFGININN